MPETAADRKAAADAAAASLRTTRRALVAVQQRKFYSGPRGATVRSATLKRIDLEHEWSDALHRSSNAFFDALDLDGAIAAAQAAAQRSAKKARRWSFLRKADQGAGGQQNQNQTAAANLADDVLFAMQGAHDEARQRLAAGMDMEALVSGAVQQYIGMALAVGEQSGQYSLDHLGLNRTFAWAHPRAMGQDLYAVRGSKVVQGMYGAHLDKLSQIIAQACDPRHPLTIDQTKKLIAEQWPALQTYQVERIARTETAAVWTQTAANTYAANGIASFESIIAQGPSIGIETEDPCEECVDAAANGPFDITDDLPPWHPNCRCEAVPVLESDSVDQTSLDSAEADWSAAGEDPLTRPQREDFTTRTQWLPPKEPWTGQTIPVRSAPRVDTEMAPPTLPTDAGPELLPVDEPVPTPATPTREQAGAWRAELEGSNYGLESPERFAAGALRNVVSGNEVRVIVDAGGDLRGAISFIANRDDYVYVRNLGSMIKGGGTQLLREAARAADDAGVPLRLVPSDSAVGFYEKLGFKDLGNGEVELDGQGLKRLAARSGDPGAEAVQVAEPSPAASTEIKAQIANCSSKISRYRAKLAELETQLDARGVAWSTDARWTELRAKLDDQVRIRDGLKGRTIEAPPLGEPPVSPPKLKPIDPGEGPVNWESDYSARANLLKGKDDALVEMPPHSADAGNARYDNKGGFAYIHDGVMVKVETSGMNRGYAETVQRQVNEMLDTASPQMRARLQSLTVNAGESPNNAAFRRMYRNFHNAAAEASSDGRISFWSGQQHLTPGVFDHELGHIAGRYNGPIWPQEWDAAAKADEKYGKTLLHDVPNGSHDDSHGFLIGRKSVSSYGANSANEDWAESVRLALRSKRGALRAQTWTGETQVSFADIFPNRAKLLKEWLELDPGAPLLEIKPPPLSPRTVGAEDAAKLGKRIASVKHKLNNPEKYGRSSWSQAERDEMQRKMDDLAAKRDALKRGETGTGARASGYAGWSVAELEAKLLDPRTPMKQLGEIDRELTRRGISATSKLLKVRRKAGLGGRVTA